MDRKENWVRNRRICIVVLWVIFLVAINMLIYHIEEGICMNNARDELLADTEIVNKQMPSLLANDYFSEIGSWKMLVTKLLTLSFALDPYDDIEKAKDLLDDYVKAGNIKGLVIYDRDGKVLYRSSEDVEADFDSQNIDTMMDLESYSIDENPMAFLDEYIEICFDSGNLNRQTFEYMWGVKDQWIIMMQNKISEVREKIGDYFYWFNALQNIRIGMNGFVLALDIDDGTVFSYNNPELTGHSCEELDIRIENDENVVSIDRLKATFDDPGQAKKIELAGTSYYAARVDNDNVFMLALMPMSEITDHAVDSSTLLLFMIASITGLCMLYALFHVGEQKDIYQKKKRFLWTRSLSSKLKVGTILAVSSVFLLGLYLEAVAAYADTFCYCQDKEEIAVQTLADNDDVLGKLQTWFDEEYLTKCSIIKCVMSHMDANDVTWEYLEELSQKMGISYIYLFDEDGNIILTNSLYDRLQIDENSSFYPLLQGSPSVVNQPGTDLISGKYIQTVGLSLRNEDHQSKGALIISAEPKELETIYQNLGYDSLFEQLCLKDGSVVLAVHASDLTVEYLGEVKNGVYHYGLDHNTYSGEEISVLGIDETLLKDNFNGNLCILGQWYFASVEKIEDHYLFLMKSSVSLKDIPYLTILSGAAVTLFFMILLIFVACTRNKKLEETKKEEDQELKEAQEEAAGQDELSDAQEEEYIWMEKAYVEKKETPEAYHIYRGKMLHLDEESLSMVNNILDKRKPYFEERWPGAGEKWKDKTQGERFAFVAKGVVLFVLFALLLRIMIVREHSIWYYCLTGEWDVGFNLYSITSCVICICGLIIIKMLSHKVLYLVARAVKPKGETICSLIDSAMPYILLIAGIFICLNCIGVDATTLSLTGGVAGVIFGIGCQNTVADILAGILMAFEGVVKVGDRITYNNQNGVVMKVGIRTTRLKQFCNELIVRNNDLKNYIYVHSDQQDRVQATLNIDLKESLEHVEDVLKLELPVIHEYISKEVNSKVSGPVYRGVQSIGDNSVVLSFSITCMGKYTGWVTRALNRELKLMCERHGINIAMPQVVVNTPESYTEKKEE